MHFLWIWMKSKAQIPPGNEWLILNERALDRGEDFEGARVNCGQRSVKTRCLPLVLCVSAFARGDSPVCHRCWHHRIVPADATAASRECFLQPPPPLSFCRPQGTDIWPQSRRKCPGARRARPSPAAAANGAISPPPFTFIFNQNWKRTLIFQLFLVGNGTFVPSITIRMVRTVYRTVWLHNNGEDSILGTVPSAASFRPLLPAYSSLFPTFTAPVPSLSCKNNSIYKFTAFCIFIYLFLDFWDFAAQNDGTLSCDGPMKSHKWWRSLLLIASQPFGHFCTKWMFVATAFFIWLILIILVVVQQPQDNGTICGRGTKLGEGKAQREIESCDQIQTQMDILRADLDALKRENRRLKENALSFDPTKQSDQSEPSIYSKEHELARRELDRLIMELLYSKMGDRREEHLDDQQRNGRRLSADQLLHLLAHSRKFAQVDGAEQWHQRTLARVASRIQNALHALQHPKECEKARLLLCELNKGCGFGCQFHHVVYCLIMAVATNRTMVLERDGAEWRYSRDGWSAVFRPVGSCTFAQHVPLVRLPIIVDQFSGIDQQQNSARIVRLPVVDGLSSRPPHLPLAFPAQFADLLLTHHSNPPVYFIGQFVAFLMRTNERTNKFVDEAMRRIRFGLGPVVGLQIRRTDKVGTEAAFHHVNEYMRWAELWFRVEQKKIGIPLQKRLFIATDDKSVIEEARKEWGKKGFEIMANDESAEAAQPSNRYTDRSLLGIIADVHILAHCSFIVCTFSSQVCRLSYELMQTVQGDAAERVHSLDDIFYFGGQLAHEWEAIGAFRPETDEQIELRPGDVIGISGNHWNGFSKGTNRRTRQSGLFPSYLAREKWRIVNFGIFDRQNKNNESGEGKAQ